MSFHTPHTATKTIRRHIIFLFVLFFLCIALGYISAKKHPDNAAALLGTLADNIAPMSSLEKSSLFLIIFGTNAAKAFIAMVLGIFFGIAPIVFVAINGIVLGVIGAVFVVHDGFRVLLLGILPHGIFEVPGIIIASAYGIFLGGAFWRKIRKHEPLKPKAKFALQSFGLIVIPLLALAAFIETFITTTLLKI